MATIHVDGDSYEVDGADNLLHACLSLGLDIPYFCWHPAMGSVGACRQCAVKQYKDEDDDKGMLVMACMAPSSDGTRISIDDDEAREFRASVIEWLMIHHPHDCPVCEEGGHCHLQDMTVMTGHDRRRYRFRKRTHRNQHLGPFIAHEMNRCITCYRCTRFYNDYAGGTDLGAFGANSNIYFGRYEEGTLESPFSGNLAEVCPTGVFTDRTHSEQYTRKWDMQFGPSICHQCSVGCNISPGERYGDIRRIENRYHGEVNRFFLCDRGRFGYGYVNRKDRPLQPEWRSGEAEPVVALSVDAALDRGADALRDAQRVIGIGSPRASLESNHQLRELVGPDNFSTGIAASELACLHRMAELSASTGLRTPTLREVEEHDAVLVLGEDLIQSAARIGLSVRQAILGRRGEHAESRGIPAWNAEAIKTLGQDSRYPLFSLYPTATGLDSISKPTPRRAPEDIARLGYAIAHFIDAAAPDVADLEHADKEVAQQIASALMAADRPLVVSGGSLCSTDILDAAGNIARALARRACDGGFMLVRREANSTGMPMLGGHSLEWALDELHERRADALVVLENDLYQRLPKAQVDRALSQATTVIVMDHQRTETLDRAHLSLPAASFAEADGTLVSMEGRAQRFFQVYDPAYIRPETNIHESWRWLHALKCGLQRQMVSDINLDSVTQACADHYPALARIVDAAPGADYRVGGTKLAREPHRYSGRTSMRAHLNVSEPRAPQDADTPFSFSMEGYNGYDRPRNTVAFAWAPGWNSPQAWNKFTDEVGGHLTAGDSGIRLVEPAPGRYRYADSIPPAFDARTHEWQVVVLPRLFGGEETSARAEPIIERAGEACVILCEHDARQLGATEGEHLTIAAGPISQQFPLSIDPGMPSGLVGVPAGQGAEFEAERWAVVSLAGSDTFVPDQARPDGGEARP
ncbi:NADH-quinone oxidoreductase subunit NuoG [Marinobacter fonticola]|uniref:NADH-quinone oxidoreductase subunit NuoG n=1 Tax=Marinobacter fonticola TaxID=2603215 RepID=UPI0011E6C61E|nr:NADH-quinone oxidoreductase subunit NuoG [Marinobacter fonticola]